MLLHVPEKNYLGPLSVVRDYGWVVHLIDDDDELGHAQRLGQLRVLPRLPAAVKPCLKLALGEAAERRRDYPFT